MIRTQMNTDFRDFIRPPKDSLRPLVGLRVGARGARPCSGLRQAQNLSGLLGGSDLPAVFPGDLDHSFHQFGIALGQAAF